MVREIATAIVHERLRTGREDTGLGLKRKGGNRETLEGSRPASVVETQKTLEDCEVET